MAYISNKLFFSLVQRRKVGLIGRTGCSKKFPPNANNLGEHACNNLWKRAKAVFVGQLGGDVSEFESAEQLHVEQFHSQASPDVCYKSEAYRTKGWCRVATGTKTATAWGICSSSCALFVSFLVPLLTCCMLRTTNHGRYIEIYLFVVMLW